MTQSAAVRPEPTYQRKAAIAHGGAVDHAGAVAVEPIPDFDLDRTIFRTLEGAAARYVIRARIAKQVRWFSEDATRVQAAYAERAAAARLPDVAPALSRFLVTECDFDIEHADGSFLDHLYFCFEYAVHHYPARSPLVMLLHSILGTGTNTFAMDKHKIPALRELVTDFSGRTSRRSRRCSGCCTPAGSGASCARTSTARGRCPRSASTGSSTTRRSR